MRKRRGGHFCWACGRTRPNERFSGRGHARHVCRDCAKLGHEELAYRQGVRSIDQLIGPSGGVPGKHRKPFESFLSHTNPRLREHAASIAAAREQWHEPSIEIAPPQELDDHIFPSDEDCPF